MILVVEDEAPLAEVLRYNLEGEGFRVAVAGDGRAALEKLAAGAPVTTVALDLGYDNVSAFIARFRATFGITPGRYAAGGCMHLPMPS